MDEIKSHVPGEGGSNESSEEFGSDRFDDSFSSDSGVSESSRLEGNNNNPGGFRARSDGRDTTSHQNQSLGKSQNRSRQQKNPQNRADPKSNGGPNRGQSSMNNSGSGSAPRDQRPQDRNSQSNRTQTPNAGAGRPREGSAKPQLSSQTQKKIDNAGLDQGSQKSRNRAPETVSESHSDMEHLKSQNERIIELLKRINQNLQSGNRR